MIVFIAGAITGVCSFCFGYAVCAFFFGKGEGNDKP